MKNSKLNLLVNPFNKIAGWKAFGIGLAIWVAATCAGYLSKIGFDGAIDIHYIPTLTLSKAFIYQIVGVVSIVGVFYLSALIFAKGTRFQDILGTSLFARYPYIFATLSGLLMPDIDFNEIAKQAILNPQSGIDITGIQVLQLLVATLLMVAVSVWFIALLYNAFRVSTGLKGGKCIGVFVVSLLVAEIVSKIFLSIISLMIK